MVVDEKKGSQVQYAEMISVVHEAHGFQTQGKRARVAKPERFRMSQFRLRHRLRQMSCTSEAIQNEGLGNRENFVVVHSLGFVLFSFRMYDLRIPPPPSKRAFLSSQTSEVCTGLHVNNASASTATALPSTLDVYCFQEFVLCAFRSHVSFIDWSFATCTKPLRWFTSCDFELQLVGLACFWLLFYTTYCVAGLVKFEITRLICTNRR